MSVTALSLTLPLRYDDKAHNTILTISTEDRDLCNSFFYSTDVHFPIQKTQSSLCLISAG